MALAMREGRIRRGRWLLTGALASLAMAGASWTVPLGPGWSEVFLLVAFGLLLGAVFQGGWGFVRELRIRDPEESSRGEVFEGRVEGAARIDAPGTSEKVVAFRLVGESVRGPIDDAASAPFVLVTSGGRRLDVDPTHAVFDLPLSPLAEGVDRGVVWRWGGDASDRKWKLGTLPDGASVQVAGKVDGGSLRGTVGQPIRVRTIDPNEKRS